MLSTLRTMLLLAGACLALSACVYGPYGPAPYAYAPGYYGYGGPAVVVGGGYWGGGWGGGRWR